MAHRSTLGALATTSLLLCSEARAQHAMPLPLPSWQLQHVEATASSAWFSEGERRVIANAPDLDGPWLSGGVRYTAALAPAFALSAWIDVGASGTRGGEATASIGVVPEATLRLLHGPLVALYVGLPVGGVHLRAREVAGANRADRWGIRSGLVAGVRTSFDVGAMQGVTLRAEVGWHGTALWGDHDAALAAIHQLRVEVGLGIAFR